MANALAVLDTNIPAIPAELQQFFENESNVAPKATTPSLSYGGKIWQISLNGDTTKLMRTDPETGDETPLPVMRVVILDYNKRRGRAYYEGAYDPANVAMPICWSDDGVKPEESVTQKQHPTCENCPMAAKGSRISDNNKATVACAQHRMIAVVPAGKNLTRFPPLRLKIAITSDWDKDRSADDGYMAFQQFTDMMRAKKVPHTAMVVTKMKFDPDTAYPKVLFSVDKWLDPQTEMPIVTKLVKSEETRKLLDGTYTPNGADGTAKQLTGTTSDTGAGGADPDEQAAKQAKEAEAAAATKAATEAAAKAARAAERAKKKAEADAAAKAAADAAAKAAAAAAAADDGDDDAEIIIPGTPAAVKADAATPVNGAATAPPTTVKAPAVVAPTANEVPDDVKGLLAEWGE